jgi:hypothetical protein
MKMEYKRNCSSCNKEIFYSRKDGYERAILENRMCFSCTVKSKKYRENRSKCLIGKPISQSHKDNISKAMKGRKITWMNKIIPKLKGRIVPPDQEIKRLESRLKMNYDEYCKRRPKYFNYKSKVMSITRKQPINLLENFDKMRGLAGTKNGYQLDHIITIKNGFENNINPHIIGNIKNLQFISWEENLHKNKNSNINISDDFKNNCLNEIEKELLKIYSKFDNKLYKFMKLITDVWYSNPKLTKKEILKIANI